MSTLINLNGVRIEKSEFYQQKYYTVVASPAPDEFSHPSKFRVTSEHALGNVGTVLNIQAEMRGLVKNKQYVDKQTGQQKQYDECSVYFDVVKHEVFVPRQPNVQPVNKAV